MSNNNFQQFTGVSGFVIAKLHWLRRKTLFAFQPVETSEMTAKSRGWTIAEV